MFKLIALIDRSNLRFEVEADYYDVKTPSQLYSLGEKVLAEGRGLIENVRLGEAMLEEARQWGERRVQKAQERREASRKASTSQPFANLRVA